MEKQKKVDIGNLPVYRALNARNEFASLKEFYEKTLKKTGRDRTVQRESVWREKPPKQAEYMSAVAFGYSQTSLFHLVNIEESIKYLLPKAEYPQDYQYNQPLLNFKFDSEDLSHFVMKGSEYGTEVPTYATNRSWLTLEGTLIDSRLEPTPDCLCNAVPTED